MCHSIFILLFCFIGLGTETHLMGTGWGRGQSDRPDRDGVRMGTGLMGMGIDPQEWGGDVDKFCRV